MLSGTPAIAATRFENNRLLLARVEQAERGARLAEVVIPDPVVVAVDIARRGGSATSGCSTGPPNELGS